ncbi:MAG: imidazoleglycerol-phosphate dehydratase HisB [Clostridiales bacterium]|nr:imidazoleglycerol-phosphate dehydratase HisB [Clostridiales bacterium]
MAQLQRKTNETDIAINLNLDGGEVDINTGIGFFDHMLTALAVHSGFGLKISAKGDLQVDGHHTVEDVGIVLGMAFAKALGDKGGIARFGNMSIPMDEALSSVVLDISGRPFLVFCARFEQEKVGDFDSCLCEEFFRAFAFNAGITLHANSLYGTNTHHQIESLFKALAHALKMAVVQIDGGVLSTKGTL